MIVFRLTAEKFKNDLTGKGAEIYGGRWNPVGCALLYTSESRALASLEIMVNTVPGVMPVDYYILEIETPDTAAIYEMEETQLPDEWRKMEHYTQFAGYNIISQRKHLVIKVPSACITHEYNYLINPAHPHMKDVKLLGSEPFTFDERLFPSK